MAFVFAFFIGTSVDSFVNVVADRLPAGQSLVRPGSHCPVCHTPLRTFDLLPVTLTRDPATLVVNSHDAHPNELANRLFADDIWSAFYSRPLP